MSDQPTSAKTSAQHTAGPWVRYNPNTAAYETPDGTVVAEELADNIRCIFDVLVIARIRDEQRAAIRKATEHAA